LISPVLILRKILRKRARQQNREAFCSMSWFDKSKNISIFIARFAIDSCSLLACSFIHFASPEHTSQIRKGTDYHFLDSQLTKMIGAQRVEKSGNFSFF
ncbi:hypothetical protein PMAYCL1PPCAC_01270, partial [Pristionchus mayeri]